MKNRWLWVLLLPYSIIFGSETYRIRVIYDGPAGSEMIECANTETVCEDMAAALNAAHERRITKIPDCGDHYPAYFGCNGCQKKIEGKINYFRDPGECRQ